MDRNQGSRKSERPNIRILPPVRYGFKNVVLSHNGHNAATQNQFDDCADVGSPDRKYAKSEISRKAVTKASRRNVREIEYLKKTLAREKELNTIEILQLEKKKEFLLKSLNT